MLTKTLTYRYREDENPFSIGFLMFNDEMDPGLRRDDRFRNDGVRDNRVGDNRIGDDLLTFY